MLGALSVLVKCGSPRSFVEDNDFAEFEEFDEEEGRQFENLLLNTVYNILQAYYYKFGAVSCEPLSFVIQTCT